MILYEMYSSRTETFVSIDGHGRPTEGGGGYDGSLTKKGSKTSFWRGSVRCQLRPGGEVKTSVWQAGAKLAQCSPLRAVNTSPPPLPCAHVSKA